MPYSYGGKFRSVQIDLDPQAMQARGLSATDVQNAFANQNQITPAGNIKIGSFQYVVKLNNAADTIEAHERPAGQDRERRHRLPARRRPCARRQHACSRISCMSMAPRRAVHRAQERPGLHHRCGQRHQEPAAAAASQQLPDALKIDVLADQSLFVKAAINGVVREGAIAAGLTSLMILFFLGSWRSTVIIATSIPLAVLCALMALWATGQTLNIMTLGGLALAVGILVDDATVTIENINWHLEHGKARL